MNPKKALIEVGHRALMHNFLHSPGKYSDLKPGEFIEKYATDEEKEAFKKLKSKDAQNMIRQK